MKIGNYTIGQNYKPFIIAEMSGNHNHSLERALKIIETAAKCGADAIKLQTYTADTMTIESDQSDFFISKRLCACMYFVGKHNVITVNTR